MQRLFTLRIIFLLIAATAMGIDTTYPMSKPKQERRRKKPHHFTKKRPLGHSGKKSSSTAKVRNVPQTQILIAPPPVDPFPPSLIKEPLGKVL